MFTLFMIHFSVIFYIIYCFIAQLYQVPLNALGIILTVRLITAYLAGLHMTK